MRVSPAAVQQVECAVAFLTSVISGRQVNHRALEPRNLQFLQPSRLIAWLQVSLWNLFHE